MTTPAESGIHPRTWPKPKFLIVVLTVCATFGGISVVASVVSAWVGITTQEGVQEDVRENQRLLNAVCENTRSVTSQFTTASPAPCPTVKP